MENPLPNPTSNTPPNHSPEKQQQEPTLNDLAPKTSIQQSFKKFQKQKFYQLKLNRFLKNVKINRNQPQFKIQLRQKFISTAKKYIGIPYAQRYHKPTDPLYNSPLFLDCCALIRQIIFDLRQQFCYTMNKWNQSYQFDLLPNQNLQQQDLQPGDLIFYSATYYNPKLKPFPHDMVHVEIYLGNGKSIGARFQKSTIQVFDSYQFQSKIYHSIKYHYRSIDSWLEGKFQSHCAEHKWKDDRNGQWLSDKFSVFADPRLDDIQLPQNQPQPQYLKVMIGKGNNNKLLKKYFTNLTEQNQYTHSGPTYVFMDQKDQFNPHYFFKWVQSPGQIDFYSFKQGQQIVNHIPNILQILASKLQLLKTIKQFQLVSQTKNHQLTLNPDSFLPKTYRLDVMSDEISFINNNTQGLWIYKPRNLNQGRGIKMIADVGQFKRQFIQSKKFYLGEYSLNNMLYYKPELLLKPPTTQQNQHRYQNLKHDGLIQQYIRPLLIHNRKFDIRCYMLINTSPNIVLFHPGYLRLTLQQYDEEDIENDQKLMIHLTNNCYQNKHKQYKQKKQQSIKQWSAIIQQIGQPNTQQLAHKIKKILLITYASAKNKIIRKKGNFQLLGCDFLVNNQLNPYLLEINTNPALFTDTQTQLSIIPPLIHNTLDLVLTLFQDDQQNSKLTQIQAHPQKYGYQLLYSQHNKYIYHDDQDEDKIIKNENGLYFINGLEIATCGDGYLGNRNNNRDTNNKYHNIDECINNNKQE